MNSRSHNPHDGTPGPDDALLKRYHEANALDDARPSPMLRDRVLAQARAAAGRPAQGTAPTRAAAANDSAWKLRALGGLAVFGLVGLLALQFDRGTPEEREVAFGQAPRPSAPAAPPADASGSVAPLAKTDEPASLPAATVAPPVTPPAAPPVAPRAVASGPLPKSEPATERAAQATAPATAVRPAAPPAASPRRQAAELPALVSPDPFPASASASAPASPA